MERELLKRKKTAEQEKKRRQREKDKEMAILMKKQQALHKLRRQRFFKCIRILVGTPQFNTDPLN